MGDQESRNTKRRHGSTLRSGWKLHHDTRKQNHQHATTTRERPRKNSRILRTHHQDPRPPRILSQTVHKGRRGPWRIFPGVFRRSFTVTVVSSLTVVRCAHILLTLVASP